MANFAGSVIDGKTGELIAYCHLIKRPKYKDEWKYSFGNNIVRLTQGIPGRSKGTETVFLIDHREVLVDRWKDVTYGRKILATMCDHRTKRHIVKGLLFGWNNIVTDIECGTPTANLLTFKPIFNSIVSTPGVKFLGLDLMFNLNTPMDRLVEFLRLKLKVFPDDIIREYNLMEKVNAKEFVILHTARGMHGIPYASIRVQKFLT